MMIATWNVNSLRIRMERFLPWLERVQPDVVCLQELKLSEAQFPYAELEAAGYGAAVHGQPTYNGVAILSRHPLADVQVGIPGFEDEQKRAIAATINGVRVVNLYVVNGKTVGCDKYDYKLRWIEAVHGWLSDELKQHPRLVVLGDFNIAPEDRDVHDPVRWNEDTILTSTAERAALRRLQQLGLHDSFRLHNEEGGHFSWWDYRAAGFRRNLGLRIDLALVSEALKARTTAAHIDREPRLWDRPSDHAPVFVELS